VNLDNAERNGDSILNILKRYLMCLVSIIRSPHCKLIQDYQDGTGKNITLQRTRITKSLKSVNTIRAGTNNRKNTPVY
jgi:hypothetical protein